MPRGGGVFLAGPAVVLLLLAVCACVLIVGAWSRRVDRLRALEARARARCGRDRALPMLWGVSAGALVFALSALLLQIHPLALFGVLLLTAGAGILSLGLIVAACVVGDALSSDGAGGPRRSLGVGLAVLLAASCLPYAGWLLCLLAVATGTGAVLESLVGRD